MGGSHSKSVSHFAHPEPGHSLKRVEGHNLDQVWCRMCWTIVEPNAAAYCCTRAAPPCVPGGFFLHDACFHRPKQIDSHYAHPSHPLTLSGKHNGGRTAARSCSICAGPFDPLPPAPAGTAFVYSCSRSDCHGFYAHPNCCELPRKLATESHQQHELTLLSPPPRPGHRHDEPRRRSTCLNPQCRNRGRRPTKAWSYQCLQCNVHLCLECRVQEGGRRRQPSSHGSRCGGERLFEIFGCMREAAGTFGRRFACACLGNPGAGV